MTFASGMELWVRRLRPSRSAPIRSRVHRGQCDGFALALRPSVRCPFVWRGTLQGVFVDAVDKCAEVAAREQLRCPRSRAPAWRRGRACRGCRGFSRSHGARRAHLRRRRARLWLGRSFRLRGQTDVSPPVLCGAISACTAFRMVSSCAWYSRGIRTHIRDAALDQPRWIDAIRHTLATGCSEGARRHGLDRHGARYFTSNHLLAQPRGSSFEPHCVERALVHP